MRRFADRATPRDKCFACIIASKTKQSREIVKKSLKPALNRHAATPLAMTQQMTNIM
jgi:hypothetical protein